MVTVKDNFFAIFFTHVSHSLANPVFLQISVAKKFTFLIPLKSFFFALFHYVHGFGLCFMFMFGFCSLCSWVGIIILRVLKRIKDKLPDICVPTMCLQDLLPTQKKISFFT